MNRNICAYCDNFNGENCNVTGEKVDIYCGCNDYFKDKELVSTIKSQEPKKRYGAAIRVSSEILKELLGIKGHICHVESDPVTNTFKFYVLGEESEYPEAIEGSQAADCIIQHKTSYCDACKSHRINEVQVIDITAGKDKKYTHFIRGEEDEKL